jgi:two-component sensor histidine kinase
VPLALIANELVTNAAKHAYPDGAGGPVRITLTRVPPGGGGGHVLTVADEGRGLPPGSAALRPGTATLGMRLLEALADQIGARLTLAEGGPGTRISVTFGQAGPGA